MPPNINHGNGKNEESSEYDDENEDGNDEEYMIKLEDNNENTNQSDNNERAIKTNDPLDLTVKSSSNEIKVNRMKRQYSCESGLNTDTCQQQQQQQQQQQNDVKIKKMATLPQQQANSPSTNKTDTSLTISSASSTTSSTSPSPIQNSSLLKSCSPSPALNNSYMSSSNSNNATNFSKPLKSVLPPVSQEQFDKYSFINTEDLVKRVKDLLSKYSISQRLFGEYILGLSQGSVSDLLARPKPWMMLTQKGREPFIRMQIFIDDNDAIKKLMSNQYKIPSDKFVQRPPVSFNPSTPVSYSKFILKFLFLNFIFNFKFIKKKKASQTISNGNFSQSNDNSIDELVLNNSNIKNDLINKPQTQLNIIPYDISTLTSSINDINTEEITNKVKETLLNNNIGQKLFGEAVLNLSQGTVSELLSKPKPWNTLSIKGREPYLRMYMWLNDVQRLEKLNEWKEERNCAYFSLFFFIILNIFIFIFVALKRTNTEVENDQQKPKRRFIFTEDQKEQLMKAFRFDPYPSVNQMELLAGMLNLATRTVINWFHNHRMRIRYKNTSISSNNNNNNSNNNNFHLQSPQNSKFNLEHYTALSKLKYSSAVSPYTLNGACKNTNNNRYYDNNNNKTSSDEYNDGGNEYEMLDEGDDVYDFDTSTNGNQLNDEYTNQGVDDNNINVSDNEDNEMIQHGEDDNQDNEQINEEDDDEINSLVLDGNSSEKYNSDASNDSVDMKMNTRQLYNQYAANLNATRSNKRRKPDNPQKLSHNNANSKVDNLTSKLLNNKILQQQQQQQQQLQQEDQSDAESNDEETAPNSVTNGEHQINDNIVVH